jgi:hypothetical protein
LGTLATEELGEHPAGGRWAAGGAMRSEGGGRRPTLAMRRLYWRVAVRGRGQRREAGAAARGRGIFGVARV